MQAHYVAQIHNREQARAFLEKTGSSQAGIDWMLPKAVFRCVMLKNIAPPAANIIKQEMLAKGGEAAVAYQALTGEENSDVLLMGTLRQYELLTAKLRLQPFKLKYIAEDIDRILNHAEPAVKSFRLAGGKSLPIGERTLIMGILNVTPDSFSDGGRYFDPARAVEHAQQMMEEGADIIDVGGASSRPSSTMASTEEELARVLPVVEALVDKDILVSVDTFRAPVAEAVLERGAHLINDIGNLTLDPQLLEVLVRFQAPVAIMHNRMQMRQGESYKDLIADIAGELQASIEKAVQAGLPGELIMVDPGIGFGKNQEENLQLLGELASFKSLGCPILLGASRKTFIGQTLNLEVQERVEGSLAAVAIGIMNGADMVRVHDVRASKRVAMMTDAVVHQHG